MKKETKKDEKEEIILDQYLHLFANQERLEKEYLLHGSLVIGVDFDGTIHDFHKTGAIHDMVIQLIKDLKSINCKIIIWTAYKDLDYVAKFCSDRNIIIDGINTNGIPLDYESRKPFFSALLDDRAGLIQAYYELRNLVNKFKPKEDGE